jgi:hypothetical protein
MKFRVLYDSVRFRFEGVFRVFEYFRIIVGFLSELPNKQKNILFHNLTKW